MRLGEAVASSSMLPAATFVGFVPHFYPHFIPNTKPIRVKKKKKKARVKALLFPFPHQMCSAASAVKWISVDRQMRCSLGSLWPLAES